MNLCIKCGNTLNKMANLQRYCYVCSPKISVYKNQLSHIPHICETNIIKPRTINKPKQSKVKFIFE